MLQKAPIAACCRPLLCRRRAAARCAGSTCSRGVRSCAQAYRQQSQMLCARRGLAPLLLLALSLSCGALAAGALQAPQPSQQRSQVQRSDAIGAAEGGAPLAGGGAGAAAGGGRPGRSLLKQAAKPPPPSPPLPNFEIGVPAPPKQKLRCVGAP